MSKEKANIKEATNAPETEAEECQAIFEPLVRLGDVEVVSGEENEDVLYEILNAQDVLAIDEGEKKWSYRGKVHAARILRDSQRSSIRLLVRSKFRIVVNHVLGPNISLEAHKTSDHSWVWKEQCMNVEGKMGESLFCIRFRSAKAALEFKTEYTAYKEEAERLLAEGHSPGEKLKGDIEQRLQACEDSNRALEARTRGNEACILLLQDQLQHCLDQLQVKSVAEGKQGNIADSSSGNEGASAASRAPKIAADYLESAEGGIARTEGRVAFLVDEDSALDVGKRPSGNGTAPAGCPEKGDGKPTGLRTRQSVRPTDVDTKPAAIAKQRPSRKKSFLTTDVDTKPAAIATRSSTRPTRNINYSEARK